jgi:hypothetical protein
MQKWPNYSIFSWVSQPENLSMPAVRCIPIRSISEQQELHQPDRKDEDWRGGLESKQGYSWLPGGTEMNSCRRNGMQCRRNGMQCRRNGMQCRRNGMQCRNTETGNTTQHTWWSRDRPLLRFGNLYILAGLQVAEDGCEEGTTAWGIQVNEQRKVKELTTRRPARSYS